VELECEQKSKQLSDDNYLGASY